MSQITPNSQIWLCHDVPLDPNYDNTMTFTTGSGTSRKWDSVAQLNYFMSKAVYTSTKFSVIRERRGVVRMTGLAENQFSMYKINYMVFTNTNFDNKYFYAFVSKIEYINPGTTFIYFNLDKIQTWMSELEFGESNIDREHVEDDTIFKNLEEEGIQINDRLSFGSPYNFEKYLGQKMIVLGSTEPIIRFESAGEMIPYNPYTYAPRLNPQYTYTYQVSNVVSYPDSTMDPNLAYDGYYSQSERSLLIKLNYNYVTFTVNSGVHTYDIVGERKAGTNNFKFSVA